MSQAPTRDERNADLLSIYCNDHHAAATGGIELVSRMIGVHRGSDYEQPLADLLDQLREEQASLRAQMTALGLPAHMESFDATIPGTGTVALHNVFAVVAGRSPQTIVLTAHRDNAGSDLVLYRDNAAATAA